MKKTLSILFLSTIIGQAFSQQVKNTGSMANMGKENFAPHIRLDTLPNKNTLVGLGPLGRMQGEIMVLDGKPFAVSVNANGEGIVSNSWKIEAPFFVYANVEKWQEITAELSINNLDDLQKQIEEIAKKQKIDLSEPFPFKITGNFDKLTTHIVMPRSADVVGFQEGKKQADYQLTSQKGELLGFYSQKHQGTYTHKDSFIHVHFISSDFTTMGHVDKIEMSKQKYKVAFAVKKK